MHSVGQQRALLRGYGFREGARRGCENKKRRKKRGNRPEAEKESVTDRRQSKQERPCHCRRPSTAVKSCLPKETPFRPLTWQPRALFFLISFLYSPSPLSGRSSPHRPPTARASTYLLGSSLASPLSALLFPPPLLAASAHPPLWACLHPSPPFPVPLALYPLVPIPGGCAISRDDAPLEARTTQKIICWSVDLPHPPRPCGALIGSGFAGALLPSCLLSFLLKQDLSFFSSIHAAWFIVLPSAQLYPFRLPCLAISGLLGLLVYLCLFVVIIDALIPSWAESLRFRQPPPNSPPPILSTLVSPHTLALSRLTSSADSSPCSSARRAPRRPPHPRLAPLPLASFSFS